MGHWVYMYCCYFQMSPLGRERGGEKMSRGRRGSSQFIYQTQYTGPTLLSLTIAVKLPYNLVIIFIISEWPQSSLRRDIQSLQLLFFCLHPTVDPKKQSLLAAAWPSGCRGQEGVSSEGLPSSLKAITSCPSGGVDCINKAKASEILYRFC